MGSKLWPFKRKKFFAAQEQPAFPPKLPTLTEIRANLPDTVIWIKGEKKQITTHFTADELQCKCSFPSCRTQRVAGDLIARLEKLRLDVGKPLILTSVFRCAAHQATLRDSGVQTATGLSQHELGRAADIATGGHLNLDVAASSYFSAIGKAKSFIHVDLRNDKPRRWSYGS